MVTHTVRAAAMTSLSAKAPIKATAKKTTGANTTKARKKKRSMTPLTAYNIFFRYERARLIALVQSTGGNYAATFHVAPPVVTKENLVEYLRENPLPQQSPGAASAGGDCWGRKKRSHVKTHGAISFADLNTVVSTNWRTAVAAADSTTIRAFREVTHELKIEFYRRAEDERQQKRKVEQQQQQLQALLREAEAATSFGGVEEVAATGPGRNDTDKRAVHYDDDVELKSITAPLAAATKVAKVVEAHRPDKKRSVSPLSAAALARWPVKKRGVPLLSAAVVTLPAAKMTKKRAMLLDFETEDPDPAILPPLLDDLLPPLGESANDAVAAGAADELMSTPEIGRDFAEMWLEEPRPIRAPVFRPLAAPQQEHHCAAATAAQPPPRGDLLLSSNDAAAPRCAFHEVLPLPGAGQFDWIWLED